MTRVLRRGVASLFENTSLFKSIGASLIVGLMGLSGVAAAAPPTAYKIQPGDTIEVAIIGIPDFRYKNVVGLDGLVTLPMIAPVPVAGLDLPAAQTLVKEQLSRKLYQQRGPDGREVVSAIAPDSVMVTIAEYRPVYLTGDVSQPGQQAYRPGLTVRQTISLAGGYEIMRFRSENPFLKSADLRNEFESQWIQYVRSQSDIWRLRTQLASTDGSALPQSLEQMTDAPLPKEILDRQRTLARQQLGIETNRMNEEQAFLQSAVKVADEQVSLLADRRTKDGENVSADATDYQKLKEFSEKGVVPMNRLSEARRLYLYSATQALQTNVQFTNITRERDEARRNIARLTEKRRDEMLKALNDATSSSAEIRSRLQAVSEKIAYTGIIRSQLARGGGAKPKLTIIRSAANGGGQEAASEDSPVQPGDTIEVALDIALPDAKSQ